MEMLWNGKTWLMSVVASAALLGGAAAARANQITLEVWEDNGARTSYTLTDIFAPGEYDFGPTRSPPISATLDFMNIAGQLIATNENTPGASQIAIDLTLSAQRRRTLTHTLHVKAIDSNFIVPGVSSFGTDMLQGKNAPNQPATNISTFGTTTIPSATATADSSGNLGVVTTSGTFLPPPGQFTMADELALQMGPLQRNTAPAEGSTSATIVPEPTSMIMAIGALAGIGLGAWTRRRR
jgi:hypothetical protein